jgi:hypothetical protein
MGAYRGDPRTTVQRNRQARQDALREYIAEQRHEQQAVEAIKEMRNAPDQFELTKWDKVFGAHMRLLDKYLPAQKEVAVDAVVDAVAEIRSVNVRGVGTGDKDA